MQKFRPSHEIRTLALSTVAALMLCAPAVRAQQDSMRTAKPAAAANKHAKHQQDEMTEHLQKMTKELKLTDDQAAKVKDLMQAQWGQMSEMRAKYKAMPSTPESKAEMEKAHAEMHANFEASLATVCTPEQMTEYKKMSAEHMKKKGAKAEHAEKEAKEAAAKAADKK